METQNPTGDEYDYELLLRMLLCLIWLMSGYHIPAKRNQSHLIWSSKHKQFCIVKKQPNNDWLSAAAPCITFDHGELRAE